MLVYTLKRTVNIQYNIPVIYNNVRIIFKMTIQIYLHRYKY